MSYTEVIKFELQAYQNDFMCRHNIIPYPTFRAIAFSKMTTSYHVHSQAQENQAY